MDNIPETEQPRSERAVSIGEEFHPFDPRHVGKTHRETSVFKLDELHSSIILDTESNTIPINVLAFPFRSNKIGTITPFDPELGYQIDSEDLTPESRITKIKRLRKQLDEDIDFSKAPLALGISGDSKYISRLSEEETATLKEEAKKLRLFLFFPKGSFEARPSPEQLERRDMDIDFSEFYPIDSGPLPSIPIEDSEHLISTGEGFNLYLPSDPEKLAQIRARFVLAEEQPQE